MPARNAAAGKRRGARPGDPGRPPGRSWRHTLGSYPLLDSAALARILEAPEQPVSAEPRGAVERALNELTTEFFHLAFAATPSADDLQEDRDLLDAMRRARARHAHFAYQPSLPSLAWDRAFESWLETEGKRPRRKGAPGKGLHRYVVPRLMAFFELAFGLEARPGASDPTGARDSPAARFLREYFRVVLEISKRATAISEAEGQQFIRAWTAPAHIPSLIRRYPILPEPAADAAADTGVPPWPEAKLLGAWGAVLKVFIDAGGDPASATRAPAEVKEIMWGEFRCFIQSH